MSQDLVMVLDCGATSVRAIAVDTAGKVVARASRPNVTGPSAEDASWHVWPVDAIFDKFCDCAQEIAAQINQNAVKAVTVTTFGVDGALVDKQGELLYPVISWKCPRNVGAQERLQNYVSPDKAAQVSGVGHFAFNTINKLVWLKENQADAVEQAHAWLFISSIFTHRLTGCFSTDVTMAGTSQLADLKGHQFSSDLLDALSIQSSLFPKMVQAGDVVGELTSDAAQRLGLKSGIPVVSAGHDTQFAMFGAGASQSQPVLSSGTWEILMARTTAIDVPGPDVFAKGFTCEWDATPGGYNPGLQWLASGVLEWVAKQMFRDLQGPDRYEQMIAEAEAAPVSCHGVQFNPDVLQDQSHQSGGAISGITLNASRADIYRAALEAMALKLKANLSALERIGKFSSQELVLVGGGSRNRLWNQMKADALQMPVKVLEEAETTVLGAAMFAMAGAGLYESAEQARSAFQLQYHTICPGDTLSIRS